MQCSDIIFLGLMVHNDEFIFLMEDTWAGIYTSAKHGRRNAKA